MRCLRKLLMLLCFVNCFAVMGIEAKKPIAVVICSYNNRKFYEKNLESVLNQNYPNYRIIYTDDFSPDGTGDAVEEYIKGHSNGHKVKLVRNERRLKAMANLWHAIHSCRNEEIVITLDGDDWLPHDNVLEVVNSYYQDPNVWLAYSNHTRHPDGKGGISRPMGPDVIKKRGIRNYPYVVSHLRSFYAGLFKRIKLQDLTYEGDFVPTTYDLAMMFPMLEMAEGHIRYMKEKLYVYNCINPISDHRASREMQGTIDRYTRKLKPYLPLTVDPTLPLDNENNQVDIVVFSYNRPMQLYAYIESLYKNATNCNQITAIYRASSPEYEEGYAQVTQAFPKVNWKKQLCPPGDFQKLTRDAIFNSKAKFVAFAVDDIIIKDSIDFAQTTRLMNQTLAYGFYLRMGKNINRSYMAGKKDPPPKMMAVEPGVYAWQFSRGGAEWGYPNTLDMTVYRKSDIKNAIEQVSFTNPSYMEGKWSKRADKSKIGLCYELSKTINIPMNVVTTFKNKNFGIYSVKDLLTKFIKGYRMDIDVIQHMVNNSPHVNVLPEFKQQSI